jgi:tetratricopeptide (TPR) repeat protein
MKMTKEGLPLLRAAGLVLLIAGPAAGCASTRPVPADVRVPPELLRGSPYTAGGEAPRSRYVVRMTDGQRDWEIQLPEIATAYEVRVPLSGKPGNGMQIDMASATAADREIIADRDANARAEEGAADDTMDGKARDRDKDGKDDAAGRPAKTGGKPPVAPGADKPVGQRASYLLTLAKVKELYRNRHYELALVELVELEKQYPNDEHILSMKGSLHDRLGNKNLAREAWQQALTLNPFNLAVLEALKRLGK